jgi:hypothetical protein
MAALVKFAQATLNQLGLIALGKIVNPRQLFRKEMVPKALEALTDRDGKAFFQMKKEILPFIGNSSLHGVSNPLLQTHIGTSFGKEKVKFKTISHVYRNGQMACHCGNGLK